MKKIYVLVVIMLGLLLGGCAGNKLVVSQDFNARIPQIKKVGIIISDATVREVSVGGSVELLIEETASAVPVLEKVSLDSVRALNFEPKILSIDNDLRKITSPFNNITPQELYQLLADKSGKTISNEFTAASSKNEVDAFLLFRSCEKVSSVGRKAAMAAIALLGGYNSGQATYSDISLVDKSGRILYFDSLTNGKSIRDEDDVKKIFNGLLEKYNENRAKI